MSMSVRTLLVMAVLACWAGCGFSGTVESAGVRDIAYHLDTLENAFLKAVADSMNKSNVVIMHDPKISLAIFNTLNCNENLDSLDLERRFRAAGPHAVIIPFYRNKNLLEYVKQCCDLMAGMENPVHVGMATVNIGEREWLAVYATDIELIYDNAKSFRKSAMSPFPDMPGAFQMSICGTTKADSVYYILYRGPNRIIIPTESIIRSDTVRIDGNYLRIYLDEDFYENDVMTINIYGRNPATRSFELIGIEYAPLMIPYHESGRSDDTHK